MTAGTALVTGGTRGIGRAIALRLAEDGHALAINYASDAESAERVLDELRAIRPDCFAVREDLTAPEGCARVIDGVLRGVKHLDVLVNNVGSARPTMTTGAG
jgi:3-oxoacyl-[acyl-carrier protein] reductase